MPPRLRSAASAALPTHSEAPSLPNTAPQPYESSSPAECGDSATQGTESAVGPRCELRHFPGRALFNLVRSDATDIQHGNAWLTTIVDPVCLDSLCSRAARREEPMGVHVPDPVLSRAEGASPEDEALLADYVGLALQVVLEMLALAGRLAFVVHDMFDSSFDETAPTVSRDATTRRQLANRARRRARDPRSDPLTPISAAGGQ